MLLALALVIAAQIDTPFNGCAWVRAENDGAGSGFIVDADERLLITCRHVVADRKKVDVFFPWVRAGELITDRREYLRNRDMLSKKKLLVTGTVLKTSDDTDLALVQLDALPLGTRAVRLTTKYQQPGEMLGVVGNRLDLDTVWNVTTGSLRATGTLTDGYFWRGKKLAKDAHVYVAQLPIEEGDSGGPVFNARGEVVGMECALRRQCPLAAVVITAREIQLFRGASDVSGKSEEPSVIVSALHRATVWVKPTATDVHIAGALIENDLVLTCARGLTANERVGVALQLGDADRWESNKTVYRDPLTLHLRHAWRSGTVLARDPARDLAIIKLDSGGAQLKPLPLADTIPKAGDALHAMSHPGGLEFAWVYANGFVRQRGRVALDAGEKAPRVSALVCQLPAQTGSPGGPIANAKGELVGVLSAREGAQLVAYAATTDEIRAFLDVALRDRPAKTLMGLLARIESLPQDYASSAARGFATRAEEHRKIGTLAEAKRNCDSAVSLDPGCAAARYVRARMLEGDAAIAELDAAVEKGTFNRDVLVLRAELAARAKDWRKARGDLERILDVFPADARARQQLVGVLLGLGEDAKAALAVSDTLRTDSRYLAAVVFDLLAQAEALELKFPDAPAIPADWLTKALTAAEKGTSDAKQRAAIADVLKAVRDVKDDKKRYHLLRTGMKGLK